MSDASWTKALRIVQQTLPKGYELSATQLVALQAAWEEKGYKEYAKKGCSSGYMSNVMVEVYSLLSQNLGTEVRKNNFRKTIEEIILGKIYFEETLNSAPVLGTPPKASFFVGREQEQEFIENSYTKQKVVVINGAEGIGKTAFISVFFNKISKTNNFQKYVWYSALESTFEDNILQINKLINFNKSLNNINDLLESIGKTKTLIVVDGIEQWISRHLDETTSLVKRIITLQHDSLFIFTFRNQLEWFNSLQQQGYPVLSLKLEGLSLEASRQLFFSYGIKTAGIEQVFYANRGVPYLLLDACNKINFMNGDINRYLKYKTMFLTKSAKDKLNNIFANELTKITSKERYILYFLMKTPNDNLLDINEFMELVASNSEYTIPDIQESIKLLEDYSLLSIDRSSNRGQLLKHDEVRGYLVQDPLKLFQFEAAL